MDQASTLRQLHGARSPDKTGGHRPQVIAITSGKGGVGKTNLGVNLCLALTQMKRRVFLMDADVGLANIDVILGITPKYSLEHMMRGERTLAEVVVEQRGMKILPGSSGMTDLLDLSSQEQARLFDLLSPLDAETDFLVVDTGAGIHASVMRFNTAADRVLVVATPEPTSITDAYALIKLLSGKYGCQRISVVANMVANEHEAQGVYDRLDQVCRHYLNLEVDFLGWVPSDPYLTQSVRKQIPLMESFPKSPAAQRLRLLAQTLLNGNVPAQDTLHFWERLKRWKKL
ncbi:MAG: MinD/ParA family protein [Deltaproteobacteria bacterium]|nr:MinD/ParA family protein [Deltaproteobacteria bacterium]